MIRGAAREMKREKRKRKEETAEQDTEVNRIEIEAGLTVTVNTVDPVGGGPDQGGLFIIGKE